MYTHADCNMRETYVGSNTKDPSGRPGFYKRSDLTQQEPARPHSSEVQSLQR
jgi:hypothetical protein